MVLDFGEKGEDAESDYVKPSSSNPDSGAQTPSHHGQHIGGQNEIDIGFDNKKQSAATNNYF